MHVHVHCADGEAKFRLEPLIELKDAPIAKLTNVERPQPHHLYWPELDVDLAVESIRHPEKFPLVARSST